VTVPVDLVRDLELALDGPLDLMTMSALLDLVSAAWLERLAVEAAARRLPVYAALTYDGRIAFEPSDAYDARIVAAVNAHQRRDKGFGPALGPTAARTAIEQFERVSYAVQSGTSDWLLAPEHGAIQVEMLGGFAAVAGEMDLPSVEVDAWLTRRGNLVAAGGSSLRVGHVDLFAQPTGTR
jgi:hypothetical protein